MYEEINSNNYNNNIAEEQRQTLTEYLTTTIYLLKTKHNYLLTHSL